MCIADCFQCMLHMSFILVQCLQYFYPVVLFQLLGPIKVSICSCLTRVAEILTQKSIVVAFLSSLLLFRFIHLFSKAKQWAEAVLSLIGQKKQGACTKKKKKTRVSMYGTFVYA